MHICCWIVFLQLYAKMTKCSISQTTEISWGGRGGFLWNLPFIPKFYGHGFAKKKTQKTDHSFMSPVKHGICFWCRTVINWLSTYTSIGTTRHSSERLSLVVSRAVKENSWFGEGRAYYLWTGAAGLYSTTPGFAPHPHTGSGN